MERETEQNTDAGMTETPAGNGSLSRRDFLHLAGVAGAAVGLGGGSWWRVSRLRRRYFDYYSGKRGEHDGSKRQQHDVDRHCGHTTVTLARRPAAK